MVLLNFKEDGPLPGFWSVGIEHEAGHTAPTATPLVRCLEPIEVAFGDGLDVEQVSRAEPAFPVWMMPESL